MKKEVAVKEKNEVQIFTNTKSMGAADDITSQDIQVPVVMLMQANSEIALDDSNEIKTGDFVHSLTHEVLGHKETNPLELCIVSLYKTQVWRQGKEWIKTLDWEASMEGEYDFEHEGKPAKKHKVFNYVVFDPNKVRTLHLPDGDVHVASPMIVRLKGSYAKKINTMLKDYADFGQPSWCMSFNLTSHQEKNDEGTYQQYEFKSCKATSKEVQLAAANLCESVNKARAAGKMKVEENEGERNVTSTGETIDLHEIDPDFAPGI